MPKGTATPHARGSAAARGRSSPLITWHRQTGASFTSDLTPSQHAAAGAARKLVALAPRKSAHAASPDRGVLHSAGCGEGGAGAAAPEPPQGGRKLGRGRPGMQGIGGSGSRRAGGSGSAGAPDSLQGGRNRGRGSPGMQGIGGSGTRRAGGSGGSGGSGAPEPSQGGRNRGRGRPGMQGIGIRGRQKDGGCGATSSACSWTLAADEGPRLAATAAKRRRKAIVHLDGAIAWMPRWDCCFVVSGTRGVYLLDGVVLR